MSDSIGIQLDRDIFRGALQYKTQIGWIIFSVIFLLLACFSFKQAYSRTACDDLDRIIESGSIKNFPSFVISLNECTPKGGNSKYAGKIFPFSADKGIEALEEYSKRTPANKLRFNWVGDFYRNIGTFDPIDANRSDLRECMDREGNNACVLGVPLFILRGDWQSVPAQKRRNIDLFDQCINWHRSVAHYLVEIRIKREILGAWPDHNGSYSENGHITENITVSIGGEGESALRWKNVEFGDLSDLVSYLHILPGTSPKPGIFSSVFGGNADYIKIQLWIPLNGFFQALYEDTKFSQKVFQGYRKQSLRDDEISTIKFFYELRDSGYIKKKTTDTCINLQPFAPMIIY
jgi:hypothetical protein